MRIVFVHGSGRRSGSDAWPLQRTWDDALFLTRPGYGPGETPTRTDFEAEARLVNDAAAGGAHVVASSFGAVAAIMAAALPDGNVRSLVLAEPAAFSLGRGGAAVEAHIEAVAPVFARADSMSASEFIVAFYTSLGIADPQAPTTPDDILAARRTQLLRPPWDAELDQTVFNRVPTLVVSGNWNPEYEEIAGVLVSLGATHAHVEGFRHNPQESEEFEPLVREFWGSLAAG